MFLNDNLVSTEIPNTKQITTRTSGKRNIAILSTSASWGGLEINVLKLAGWLQKEGHNVLVICLHGTELARKCAEKQINTELLKYRRKYFDFGAAKHLAFLSRTNGFQNLIINSSADLVLTALNKSLFHKNLNVIFFLNMQFNHNKKDIWHSWLYSKVNTFVTPLRGLATALEKYTNIEKSSISVIHYGIELSRFKSVKARQKECRTVLDLPQKVFLAGTVGRIDKLKGQEYLVKAAASLIKSGLPVHVLIVGEPTRHEKNDYAQYVKDLVHELGISEYVHFRPFIENVEIAFGALDCFVLTSHSETYGMVTLEAMASGLPVVGTDSGGTPELVSEGKTGWLVPFANTELLAERLKKLYTDKNLREKTGSTAAEVAEKKFSHLRQTELLLQLMQ